MKKNPTFEEMTDKFSRALTMFAQGAGQQLLDALQIADHDVRQQTLTQMLTQAQVDPAIAEKIERAMEWIYPRMVANPAWQMHVADQMAYLGDALPFIALDSASGQRQALRHLIREDDRSHDHSTHVLIAAFQNPDWEVRATAMLAAVRLKATHLAPLVAGLTFPRTGREILGRPDQQLIRELQVVALELLRGTPVPDDLAHPPTKSRPDMHAHFLRCAAGAPTQWRSRVFLWCQALTHPVPPSIPPASLPPGIIADAGRYYLAQTRLELAWVPALPHWIGADSLPNELAHWQLLPNTVRRITPDNGYFIARRPLTFEFVDELLPGHGLAPTDDTLPYALCNKTKAQHICERLSTVEGISVTLPTANEWEMAARGPDGRRFPWGNGVVDPQTMRALTSVWGLHDALGVIGQWTRSTDARSGDSIICGGKAQPHCAYRKAVAADTLMGVRPAVHLSY